MTLGQHWHAALLAFQFWRLRGVRCDLVVPRRVEERGGGAVGDGIGAVVLDLFCCQQ